MHEAPGTHFVGAPTLPVHESVVMHLSGEKEKSKPKSSTDDDDETTTENMSENVKDDRYQTHFVEVDKDAKGKLTKSVSINHNGLNVGESIGGDFNAHHEDDHVPAPNNDAEAAKVEKESEHHREEMKTSPHDEHHNHDNQVTNELHEPQHRHVAAADHTYLGLPSHSHLERSGGLLEKQSTIEAQASERSNVLTNRNPATSASNDDSNNEEGSQSGEEVTDGEENKKNIKTISEMLTMFGKATKTLSNKIIRNANKFITNEGKAPFIPQIAQHATSNARSNPNKGNAPAPQPPHKIVEVKQLMESLNNLTNKLKSTMLGADNSNSITGVKKDALKLADDVDDDGDYKKFTEHQKHAYKSWRRQALVNFRHRNPEKPIPRNTVSLSDNSLCPKFCRLFCDPWCVKIGCCKLSQEKLNIYKEIEREATIPAADKSAISAGNA